MDSGRLGEGFLFRGDGCVGWQGNFQWFQNRVDIDLWKYMDSQQFMLFLYKLCYSFYAPQYLGRASVTHCEDNPGSLAGLPNLGWC